MLKTASNYFNAVGSLTYKGTWNASTNNPTLQSGVGTKGNYYVVSTAGTTNLDGITDWQIGDWAVFNGVAWQKVDNSDAVVSVNGQTGVVVLTASDVGAVANTTYVIAGTGLSGGGQLNANVTVSLANTAVAATSYGNSTTVATFTVNQQGQITAAANASIVLPNSGLVNSSITIGNTTVALGSTQGTFGNVTLNNVTINNGAATFSGNLSVNGNTTLGDATSDTVTITGTVQPGVVISGSSSGDALRITQTGSGNALLVEDSANPDSTPFIVDTNGTVLVGATAGYSTSGIASPVLNATTLAAGGGIGLNAWVGASAGASNFQFMKSRGTTAGDYTIVSTDDSLGIVRFSGADGSKFVSAATITGAVDGTPGTNDMPGRLVFSTTLDGASTPTERMRIDNAGRVGIGAAAAPATNFRIGGTFDSASNLSYVAQINGTIPSTTTGTYAGWRSVPSTQAAAFTLTNSIGFLASQGTIGATSTITNQYGYQADNTLTGATNNYGFYGNIASGTGRWNFYANGTADNFFAGNVGIGSGKTTPTTALDVNGTVNATNVTAANVTVTANLFANLTTNANATFATSSLPLVPEGYVVIVINGTQKKIPYYGM